MKKAIRKKPEPGKKAPWLSITGIEQDYGKPIKVGVEVVVRVQIEFAGDWMDVEEILEKGNDFGHAAITKVQPL